MINEAISSILQQEAEAVRNIPITDGYEEAVTLIVKHVHELGGNLITSGMGKAGQIAMNIATTFCSTGIPAVFLHPSEANSGKTRELLELVELTRGLVPEMQFIVITGNPDSPLAAEATICLPTRAPKEVCPLGLTPTTSTTVMTVIGDLLVVATMKRINFGYPDYAKRHHGGYLGSKSREQCKTVNK